MMQAVDVSNQAELLECFSDDFHPLVRFGKKYGPQVITDLLEELGGTKPHMAKPENFWHSLELEYRNTQIRNQFRGNNHAELGETFGLSERQIRDVVQGSTRKAKRHDKTAAIHIAQDQHQTLRDFAAPYCAGSEREFVAALLDAAMLSKEVATALRKKFGKQISIREAA